MSRFTPTDAFGREPDDEPTYAPDEFTQKIEDGEGYPAICDRCGEQRECVTVRSNHLDVAVCAKCYGARYA